MVDRSNLGQADRLHQQALQYQAALTVLGSNPRMKSFTLESQPAESDDPEAREEPVEITVAADDIATPPQMLSAIKDQVEQRIKHINEQLTQLGVAEASAAPVTAPAPRAAPAPHKPEPPKHEPPKHEPHKPPPRNTRR